MEAKHLAVQQRGKKEAWLEQGYKVDAKRNLWVVGPNIRHSSLIEYIIYYNTYIS